MSPKNREKLVTQYINTSVDDMSASIEMQTDPRLLLSLLYNCQFYSLETKRRVVERRLIKIINKGLKKNA